MLTAVKDAQHTWLGVLRNPFLIVWSFVILLLSFSSFWPHVYLPNVLIWSIILFAVLFLLFYRFTTSYIVTLLINGFMSILLPVLILLYLSKNHFRNTNFSDIVSIDETLLRSPIFQYFLDGTNLLPISILLAFLSILAPNLRCRVFGCIAVTMTIISPFVLNSQDPYLSAFIVLVGIPACGSMLLLFPFSPSRIAQFHLSSKKDRLGAIRPDGCSQFFHVWVDWMVHTLMTRVGNHHKLSLIQKEINRLKSSLLSSLSSIEDCIDREIAFRREVHSGSHTDRKAVSIKTVKSCEAILVALNIIGYLHSSKEVTKRINIPDLEVDLSILLDLALSLRDNNSQQYYSLMRAIAIHAQVVPHTRHHSTILHAISFLYDSFHYYFHDIDGEIETELTAQLVLAEFLKALGVTASLYKNPLLIDGNTFEQLDYIGKSILSEDEKIAPDHMALKLRHNMLLEMYNNSQEEFTWQSFLGTSKKNRLADEIGSVTEDIKKITARRSDLEFVHAQVFSHIPPIELLKHICVNNQKYTKQIVQSAFQALYIIKKSHPYLKQLEEIIENVDFTAYKYYVRTTSKPSTGEIAVMTHRALVSSLCESITFLEVYQIFDLLSEDLELFQEFISSFPMTIIPPKEAYSYSRSYIAKIQFMPYKLEYMCRYEPPLRKGKVIDRYLNFQDFLSPNSMGIRSDSFLCPPIACSILYHEYQHFIDLKVSSVSREASVLYRELIYLRHAISKLSPRSSSKRKTYEMRIMEQLEHDPLLELLFKDNVNEILSTLNDFVLRFYGKCIKEKEAKFLAEKQIKNQDKVTEWTNRKETETWCPEVKWPYLENAAPDRYIGRIRGQIINNLIKYYTSEKTINDIPKLTELSRFRRTWLDYRRRPQTCKYLQHSNH